MLRKTHKKKSKTWIRQLYDTNPRVRLEAAKALGCSDDKMAIVPLLHALRDHHIPVRWAISEALVKLGGTKLVAPLIDILLGMPTYLRLHAAWMLGTLKYPQAVEPLIHALRNPDWFGRAHAAWALGEIGDWRAMSLLIEAYNDCEEAVQDAARLAVQQIYNSVTTVYFGKHAPENTVDRSIWYNPDPTRTTVPLSNLKILSIEAQGCDLYSVERFLTYAVDYIGQYYLKKTVEVHIYGDLAYIYPHLRNVLTNLCKQITVCQHISLKTDLHCCYYPFN
jgi:HEAT repeat protein